MPSTALDHLTVVLVAARNPLNIGAAARAMSNFGFSRLRVVSPFDVAFREARSAVGAAQLLKSSEEFRNVAEAVADCSLVVGTTSAVGRRPLHPLKRLEEGAVSIREQLGAGRVALLFGSEKRGLSRDELSHCHWLMRIPTHSANISMNLGQAVAVCLYELIRTGQARSHGEAVPPADAGELERMTQTLFAASLASGYIKRGSETTSLEKMRRLIRRMNLSREDAETWTGALSKMKLALDRKDGSGGG